MPAPSSVSCWGIAAWRWRRLRRRHMRKKRTSAERKRTPPAMPTPRPTLRPVLEGDGEEEPVLERGTPEFEEEIVGDPEEAPLVADVVEAVLPVDGVVIDMLGVAVLPPTYCTIE